MRHDERGRDGRFVCGAADEEAACAAGIEHAGRQAGEASAAVGSSGRRKVAWSAAREEAFFAELSEVCNVTAAARAAGLADSKPAYNRKQHHAAFRARWDEAVAEGYARLELEMLERARFGENRSPAEGCSGEKQRAVPTAQALSLLKMHQARAKAPAAAGAPGHRRMRGLGIRDEMDKRFREISFRLTGKA